MPSSKIPSLHFLLSRKVSSGLVPGAQLWGKGERGSVQVNTYAPLTSLHGGYLIEFRLAYFLAVLHSSVMEQIPHSGGSAVSVLPSVIAAGCMLVPSI